MLPLWGRPVPNVRPGDPHMRVRIGSGCSRIDSETLADAIADEEGHEQQSVEP
jgi:hypothetical protein